MNVKSLSDQELLTSIETLVLNERELLTNILHHLREIEIRRLFSDLGFTSMFDYAMRKLGYSEDQACRRIKAARLLQEMPEIEEKLQSGALSLTTASMIQNHFRKNKPSYEEKLELISQAENK